MYKSDALRDPESCLHKAAADEPIFVLRAHDPLFAPTVRLWATLNREEHDPLKVREALKIAAAGEAWLNEQPKRRAPRRSRAVAEDTPINDTPVETPPARRQRHVQAEAIEVPQPPVRRGRPPRAETPTGGDETATETDPQFAERTYENPIHERKRRERRGRQAAEAAEAAEAAAG